MWSKRTSALVGRTSALDESVDNEARHHPPSTDGEGIETATTDQAPDGVRRTVKEPGHFRHREGQAIWGSSFAMTGRLAGVLLMPPSHDLSQRLAGEGY